MFDFEQCIKVYKQIKGITNFAKMFCYDCVIASVNYLEQDLSDEELKERAQIVYDYWLDTDIQISRLSDIICEHWKEYVNNDNFNIYDYIEI